MRDNKCLILRITVSKIIEKKEKKKILFNNK